MSCYLNGKKVSLLYANGKRMVAAYVNGKKVYTLPTLDDYLISPVMTSNTTPAPYAAFASSSSYTAGRAAWNAFDRDYSTVWHSGNAQLAATDGTISVTEDYPEGVYVGLDFGSSVTIGGVELQRRNSSFYQSGVDFTIEVSSDQSTWTAVVTETDYPLPTTEGYIARWFFTPVTARYIRYHPTRIGTTSSGSSVTLPEMLVYGAVPQFLQTE